MSSDIAISVRGLSKAYTITRNGAEQHSTLAETLLARLKNPLARPQAESFNALQDVSFDVGQGDVVGVIGRNGAGKSTLLKILSRITEPTAGQIDLYGRVGSLLEVGTGFHPELSGRENIYLNGAILGMTRAEIKKQFDAIVDFAGVEQFLDTPVKRYSSGMYVRLAFAVAAHLQSEILIVDEVLAVGDAAFQKKCLGKLRDVASGGRTVLLVSHHAAAIGTLCNRCIWLDGGRIAGAGDTFEILHAYQQSCTQSLASGGIEARRDRQGTGEVRCTRLSLVDENGRENRFASCDAPLTFELEYNASTELKSALVSIDIEAVDGVRLATLYSGTIDVSFDVRRGPGALRCRVSPLQLRPGRYALNVMIGHIGGWYDFVRHAASLEIRETDQYGTGRLPAPDHGYLCPSYCWEVHSSRAEAVA